MSAWVCTRTHIAAVARAATKLLGAPGPATADMLLVENVCSVEDRYSHHTDLADMVPERVQLFTLEEIERAPDLAGKPNELLKAVICLDYQSCEHGAWGESGACKLLEQLRTTAEGAGANAESKGYRDAPWGIHDLA